MVRIPSLSSYESPHGSLTSSRPVYKRDSSGVYSRLPRIAVRPLPSVIARRVVVVSLGVLGRSGRRRGSLVGHCHFLVAKNGCLTPVRSLFAASIAVSSLLASGPLFPHNRFHVLLLSAWRAVPGPVFWVPRHGKLGS